MRVGRDRNLHAQRLRRLGMDIDQIQPVGLGIDLEKTAALARGGDHPLDVDVIGIALPDQAAGRMRQDRDMAVVERADDPLRLRLS